MQMERYEKIRFFKLHTYIYILCVYVIIINPIKKTRVRLKVIDLKNFVLGIFKFGFTVKNCAEIHY